MKVTTIRVARHRNEAADRQQSKPNKAPENSTGYLVLKKEIHFFERLTSPA